jgi:nucleoside-diphosphate-sugar epimerase
MVHGKRIRDESEKIGMEHQIPILRPNITIRDAIQTIERSGFPSGFLLDGEGCYRGELFEGDLRRLLVSGAADYDKISDFEPRHSLRLRSSDLGKPHVLHRLAEDMQLARAAFVPVLSDTGEIVDAFSSERAAGYKDASAILSEAPSYSKRVLVVGGAGYLGSILTRKLLKEGYSVRVLDNFIYGRKSLADIEEEKNLEIVQGDLRHIDTVTTATIDVDAVVLLAAIVGDPASRIRPSETIETNLLASQALATACKVQHINRFVYASTCSVYGANDSLLDETAALNPVSLYARTKISSEQIILGMGDKYFAPTILRMGTLYGLSPRMRFDLVVNTMTMKAFTDKEITVFGGNQWRPLLHVEDAADAFVASLKADIKLVGNQVFNVGSDEQNYQIDQIGQIVSETLGGVPIRRYEADRDVRDYRVTFKKIREYLSFTPKRTVEYAVKEIFHTLENKVINDPTRKIYYNHYFDSSEE